MNSDFNLAVHALVYLDHKAIPLSSEELADNICTNPARVRKVMSMLSKAGLASSHEGAAGGYATQPDASAITLRDIADAMNATFVKAGWKSGDPDMDCLVSSGMGAAMDDIYAGLDSLCRESLGHIRIGDIEARLFGGAS